MSERIGWPNRSVRGVPEKSSLAVSTSLAALKELMLNGVSPLTRARTSSQRLTDTDSSFETSALFLSLTSKSAGTSR
ncbi:hypothetical protein D3C75_1046760 [compost metagenome]